MDCVKLRELGMEIPISWAKEIQEIDRSGSWVFRYQARLTKAGLQNDLWFGPTEQPEKVSNLWIYTTGACDGCGKGGRSDLNPEASADPDSESKGGNGCSTWVCQAVNFWWLGLAVVLLILWVCRRRGKASPTQNIS